MSVDARLPCFVCNRTLPNVFEDCDNQPYGGTEFTTYGHYGSTVWDDFNGDQLVLNICDDCLRSHTERLGQRRTHIPVRCGGMTGFGHVDVDRPVIPYTRESTTEMLDVDVEHLGAELEHLGGRVQWVDDIDERRDELAKLRAQRAR